MKTISGRPFILASAILGLLPSAALAQDYFRTGGLSGPLGQFTPVTASDLTVANPASSPTTGLVENMQDTVDKANFAIGPVRFSMAAGVGVEFNDNITLADDERESDIIIRPSFDLDVSWRLSELNTLRLSIGASYAKYVDHSEFDTDGILISPRSALEFRFALGPVSFVLHDRFSYQQDPFNISNISNVAQYERFENEAGLDASYDLNENSRIEAGYAHYNLWTTDDAFSEQDRSIDTVYLRPSYQILPTVRVGVRGSYSWVNFDSSDRGDGYTFLVGPFVEWQATAATTVYLEAGYQQFSLDGNQDDVFTRNLLDDVDNDFRDAVFTNQEDGGTDTSSYYVRLDINNQPTENLTQRLSFSKTTEIGFFSDTYDLYHVEYAAAWTGLRKTEIGPAVFYEYYETDGGFNETAHRGGASLSVRYHLTDSVTLGADYRFLVKDSDVDDADYYQNLAFLSVYYKF